MAMIKELFSAYEKNELPSDGGYIISTFFDANSTYTKYEVTSYNNVKDIYGTDDGITFQADGQKIFVLVEPSNYPQKHVEPAYRSDFHKIPYRQKEVEVHVSQRQDRIMVGMEPVMTYTSFTVLKSEGNNYSYILYRTDDLMGAMREFFIKSLWQDANVPKRDAEQATRMIMPIFKKVVSNPTGE